MRVPPSFALAYLPESLVAQELHRIAGKRLFSVVCQPNGWLFDHRVKTEESALAKMELGTLARLSDMWDVYGATIVVPTQREIDAAISAVQGAFPEAVPKVRARGSAETFSYDDVHLIARLGDAAPGLNDGLRAREFEIQIRTGLQYAWWRATHDVVYKTPSQSWRVQRLASQTRASLELLDAVLADLRGAAKLLQDGEDDADEGFEFVASWLVDYWAEDRRPANVTRFVSCVRRVADASGLTLEEVGALLAAARHAPPVTSEDITPFEAVLVLAIDHQDASIVDRLPGDHFVLVTEEMVRAAPSIDAVTAERRAHLK